MPTASARRPEGGAAAAGAGVPEAAAWLLALSPVEFERLRTDAERELEPGSGLLAVALRQAALIQQARAARRTRGSPPELP